MVNAEEQASEMADSALAAAESALLLQAASAAQSKRVMEAVMVR